MEKVPERISPKRCDAKITVPGRHGNLTITDSSYETYIRSTEFIVKDNRNTDKICAYFKGSGWLIFDDEPDRKYKARVANQIKFSRIIRTLKRFVVEFEVHPFAYDVFNQAIKKAVPFRLFNIGTFKSEPIITVNGNGNITLYINNHSVILKGITDTITIDSASKNAYKDTVSLNHKMTRDFPILSLGENNVSWNGNVTKLEIHPNWRWL